MSDPAAGEDTPSGSAREEGRLSRELSLTLLVLYGLGTTVGAGIYALTGEVAHEAGMRAPLSFALSAALAGTTAVGYAELTGRFPRAAGEAVFVDRAFGFRPLTVGVGLSVIGAGTVAAATISNAFGGYVAELLDVPRWLLVVLLMTVLAAVAVIGVKESVTAAAALTLIEVGGLGLVLWAGRGSLADVGGRWPDLVGPPGSWTGWSGVLGGAFLAFFAFLGFEDIDAVAEETQQARIVLPRAILITLGLTTVLYVAVAAVAVLEVDPVRLGQSDAPLALVYQQAGGAPDVIAFVGALAMVNGALIQIVMIPRVTYGLTRLGLLPMALGVVSPRTHTPVRATVGAAVAITILAASFELRWLARLTSLLTMGTFVVVNGALLAIKRREGPTSTFEVPFALPVLGIVASGLLFAIEVVRLVA